MENQNHLGRICGVRRSASSRGQVAGILRLGNTSWWPVSLALRGVPTIGPAAPLYRGRLPDRFLPRADQKPEVGSHGGLVQGWVAKAPTRGARTHAEPEVAADAFATARRAITWLSRAIAGVAIIAVVISAADKRVSVVIEFLHWFRANDAWLSNRDANWRRRTKGNLCSRRFKAA
jgi:hypothetical protein